MLHRIAGGQSGGCDYLIICAPHLEAAADTLANWKQLRGFRTKVVTTSVAGTTAGAIRGPGAIRGH